MVDVKFYDKAEDSLLKFAVIVARTEGKWIFCKHRQRDTYEIPGGHREENETLEETALRDFSSDYQVKVSAKTGEGLDELKEILAGILRSRRVYLEKVIPYQEGGKLQVIRKKGQLLSEEYTEEGIAVKAYVPAELFAMFF